MIDLITEQNQEKISPEFRSHLMRLAPDKKIRGIVLLGLQSSAGSSTSRRALRLQRDRRIKDIRKVSAESLKEIEAILARFGGRKLAESTSALGSLPFESTTAGVQALANLPQVTAILEDQKLQALM